MGRPATTTQRSIAVLHRESWRKEQRVEKIDRMVKDVELETKDGRTERTELDGIVKQLIARVDELEQRIIALEGGGRG